VAAYDNQFGEIRSELKLLRWMVAASLAFNLVILARLLFVL
jgi:hypothetical protein